jgi:kanamycin kinase
LGIADRWADLAVATLCLRWNYSGPRSWEDELLEAYGIRGYAPQKNRSIDYYRRLWQAPDQGGS